MTTRKIYVLFISAVYLFIGTAPVWPAEPGAGDCNTAYDIPGMVAANLAASEESVGAFLTVCYLYEDDEKESGYDPREVFYFGPDEDRIRGELEKRLERQDPAVKAHHDIRLIIGSSFFTTAGVMIVLGILNTEKELPKDYYKNKDKYEKLNEDLGYIPLDEVKRVYYPSVVIGAVLGGTGFYLFL